MVFILSQIRRPRKKTAAVIAGVVLMAGFWFTSNTSKNFSVQTPNGDGILTVLDKLKNSARRIVYPGESSGSIHATESRAADLQRKCRHIQNKTRSKRPIVEDQYFSQHIIVNESLKMMYCYVPKVANTNMRLVLFERFGILSRHMALSISGYDVYFKYGHLFTYLKRFSDIGKRKMMLHSFTKFLLVREPTERLISAFHSKFKSECCRAVFFKYVQYFYRTQGHRVQNSKLFLRDLEKHNLNFTEFVIFITDMDEVLGRTEEHFEPHHRLCRPCEAAYDYVGKYDTLIEDVEYIFRQFGFHISFPSNYRNLTARPSASYVDEYIQELPVYLRNKLWKYLELDYVLFDYKVPEWSGKTPIDTRDASSENGVG